MKRLTFPAAAALVSLTALAVAACGGGNDASSSTTPPKTAAGRPATFGVANNGDLGKILDDTRGRTLYLFAKDSPSNSACTGACAAAWPPLRAGGKPVIGTGLTASEVGTSARSDGGPQVTYNGHPLYTYTGDKNPGDTNGQGLTVFGGGWFALSPAGARVNGKGSNGGSTNGY
jgi:predicted lipoprotein with Yx(FWY)xxD motif